MLMRRTMGTPWADAAIVLLRRRAAPARTSYIGRTCTLHRQQAGGRSHHWCGKLSLPEGAGKRGIGKRPVEVLHGREAHFRGVGSSLGKRCGVRGGRNTT